METRDIASVRIHAERAIEWVKNIVSYKADAQLDEIWFICTYIFSCISSVIWSHTSYNISKIY